MKLSFLLFLAILASTQPTAAQVTADALVGTWKVEAARFDSAGVSRNDVETLRQIQALIVQSTFRFDADHNFFFDCPVEELRIPDGNWKFDSRGDKILIQEDEDKATNGSFLMILAVRREAEKIFFTLEESPFTLQVRRD